MITVTLNRTEFEYDIHSLIKAFFPKEDVELYYTKEAHADEKNVACTNHSAEQEEAGSSHFSIDYADDRISIAWDDAPDGPARRTFAVDFSNRTETKNALKEHLYRLLEEETGQPLPWGTLTGIRPTKIPMQMLDEGKTKEEIRFYMLHQANKRIVASVSKHMNEPLEKYPMNIENLGNTSSASIPLLLDEWNKKGRLNSGDWIILSGFGGGLTYGASLLQW